jgi:hypothetical protein
MAEPNDSIHSASERIHFDEPIVRHGGDKALGGHEVNVHEKTNDLDDAEMAQRIAENDLKHSRKQVRWTTDFPWSW